MINEFFASSAAIYIENRILAGILKKYKDSGTFDNIMSEWDNINLSICNNDVAISLLYEGGEDLSFPVGERTKIHDNEDLTEKILDLIYSLDANSETYWQMRREVSANSEVSTNYTKVVWDFTSTDSEVQEFYSRSYPDPTVSNIREELNIPDIIENANFALSEYFEMFGEYGDWQRITDDDDEDYDDEDYDEEDYDE